jgi:hypothetical protein
MRYNITPLRGDYDNYHNHPYELINLLHQKLSNKHNLHKTSYHTICYCLKFARANSSQFTGRHSYHTTHNTQHTTHNTQHTTHNTLHTTHNTRTQHSHPHITHSNTHIIMHNGICNERLKFLMFENNKMSYMRTSEKTRKFDKKQ